MLPQAAAHGTCCIAVDGVIATGSPAGSPRRLGERAVPANATESDDGPTTPMWRVPPNVSTPAKRRLELRVHGLPRAADIDVGDNHKRAVIGRCA